MSYPFSKDLKLATDEEEVWLSAQEIADLSRAGKIWGWPKSASTIRRIANREDWHLSRHARIRKGRKGGGGAEYHVTLLRTGGVWAQGQIALARLAKNEGLLARFIAVGLSAQIQRELHISQIFADCMVSHAIESGSLSLPHGLDSTMKSATDRTLRRWRQMMRSSTRDYP